jgi:hypothetical protein
MHKASFSLIVSKFMTRSILNSIYKIGIFTGLLFIANSSFAQWQLPCEEPTRKQPFFQCTEPFFRPVCGCNLKTYRNECVSYNMYGINTLLSDGVCKKDNYEFDFYPNPTLENINFALEFFESGNFSLQIFDAYGKLMYYEHRASVHRYDDVIRVADFKPGLYLITVTSGTQLKVKKLVVG